MKSKRLAALAVVVCVLSYVSYQQFREWRARRAPVQQVSASPQQYERGRYVAAAADCAACHTSSGGAPFAGGVPLASPFGTLYGSNITPDPEHGIGRYTADEFYATLTQGVARDGRRLYPAMPYVSYRSLSRADSDALYAYLMKQAPVATKNHDHDLTFPANIRIGLVLWNWLYGREGGEERSGSSAGRADDGRGRYLVETLGHCGECHTPRGKLGQMDSELRLRGNPELGRFAAPDITPAGLAERGWDSEALIEYLTAGVAPHAVASDEMLKVVQLSTSRLSTADLAAMAGYLLPGTLEPARPLRPVVDNDDAPAMRYMTLCSGCHGATGEGVPNVAIGLKANSTLRDANPRNLLVALLDGLPQHDFPGPARMQEMPAFADELNDAQIASLSTWLRRTYGGQEPVVTAGDVSELRSRQAHD